MEEKETVVEDLYKTLHEELDKGSNEEEIVVSSDQKPEDDKEIDTSKTKVDDEQTELSEEEISKLSPKAQKRIRELSEKVKDFATKDQQKEISPEDDSKETISDTQNFKSVQEFLAAVEDEPSRKLLEAFHKVITGEISETLSPVQRANRETEFETQFAKYSTIEGLQDHKDDLKKSFMANPSTPIKALIGDTVLEMQAAKIKPTDDTPADAARGEVDISTLSKEELYDYLEKNRS